MFNRLRDCLVVARIQARLRTFSLRSPGGALFSSPKTPDIPQLPPVPEPGAGEDERRERLLAEKRRRGTRSTILTGALGVLGDAPVDRPTLG